MTELPRRNKWTYLLLQLNALLDSGEPSPSASPSPATMSITQAAAAYLQAAPPVNAAGTAFKAAAAADPNSETGAGLEAQAQPYIKADATFRATLLDTNWPPSVVTDIHLLIAADAKVAADYSVLGSVNILSESTWEVTEGEDWAALQSAVSVVRHDLGLPASTQY